MPLFVSDKEYSLLRNDAALLADKADAFIRDLYKELDTVRAHANVASITAEQKYLSLSSDLLKLQSHNSQLQNSLRRRLSELANVQEQNSRIYIRKDGEIERLTKELSELHKSKRQLVELAQQKDSEIHFGLSKLGITKLGRRA
ncbi:hypothetical protein FEM48_Zijuj07G0136600 [Ziziphus jujuba var. spinosa]|uniref:Nuclear-pore anchor-like n=1 Tax=Ziziphus jujuba var. spinosa TaxID=714518 RepID=A0A978V4Y7_ZIZJJ|nr:hypothetical protein FEM48_Zijuj07G0136600 [Ziziphus jujuba var. spinosa]